jgi:hypothetical protein
MNSGYFYPSGIDYTGRESTYHRDARDIRTTMLPAQLTRIIQDILTWRDAIKEAEIAQWGTTGIGPFRYKMQQLFLDTILNGQVISVMEKRKALVTLKGFTVQRADGSINKEATDLLDAEWFQTMMGFILDAKWYGYSLINWDGISNNKITGLQIIRRANVSPDRSNVAPMFYSTKGVNFLDPSSVDDNGRRYMDWSLWIDTPNPHGTSSCGFGMLYSIALYEIFIRNNMGYNGDFVEKFVMPLVHAKTNKSIPEERDKLEEDLRRMAASTAFITDPTDEIAFVQNNSAGSGYKAYDNLEARCEKKISKIGLRHADAMDSVPGKLGSKDEVDKALESVETEDCKWFEYVATDRLFPKLRAIGFTQFGITDKFKFNNDNERNEARAEEDSRNKVMAEVVKTFADGNYEVDADYIKERTGIKVTKIEEPLPKVQMNGNLKTKVNAIYGQQ